MKSSASQERKTKQKRTLHRELDSHEWTMKTEMYRLISGRPELEIIKKQKSAT